LRAWRTMEVTAACDGSYADARVPWPVATKIPFALLQLYSMASGRDAAGATPAGQIHQVAAEVALRCSHFCPGLTRGPPCEKTPSGPAGPDPGPPAPHGRVAAIASRAAGPGQGCGGSGACLAITQKYKLIGTYYWHLVPHTKHATKQSTLVWQ
jgi:hypothetical protein